MKWLKDLLNIPYCKKCGSTHLEKSSMWNGGYNLLCNQAVSREGVRCYDCGDIVWSLSDTEYENTLPEWCVSDRELLKLKRNGNWETAKQERRVIRKIRKSYQKRHI